MADGIFGFILFYSFIAGARRGFYKEVVQTLAFVVSISVTRMFYAEAGVRLADASGMPVMAANALAGTVVWVVSFFVAAVVGRLILKKIRGEGVDDALGSGAEAFADAINGVAPYPMTDEEMIATPALWEAAVTSAALGRAVDV